jgi:hypothetical protein
MKYIIKQTLKEETAKWGVRITPEIMIRLIHTYNIIGFADDFRNYITNYLIHKAGYDKGEAAIHSMDMWRTYEESKENLVVLYMKYNHPKSKVFAQAILSLINDDNSFDEQHWSGGKYNI